MISGRFDRWIMFQRFTIGKDANGGPVKSWNNLIGAFAQYRPTNGTELLKGTVEDRVVSSQTAHFFTHYTDGLTVKDRIQYQDKNWNITYLREIGRREGLEIVAVVVV